MKTPRVFGRPFVPAALLCICIVDWIRRLPLACFAFQLSASFGTDSWADLRFLGQDDSSWSPLLMARQLERQIPRRHCRSLSFTPSLTELCGWVQQGDDDEWEWIEDDPNYEAATTTISVAPPLPETITTLQIDEMLRTSTATPKLPPGTYKPKQSLGQNYLKDGNTVMKILRAFHSDASSGNDTDPLSNGRIVELGPGAGALTDKLVEIYGTSMLQCIEIDDRSVAILKFKHPDLLVRHQDVLQADYVDLARSVGSPLAVIGNLPYYITSQILFALADASHYDAVKSATVTMQWEVAQRIVARPCTKDYGILSVVFQLYADTTCHFKIPPTVFYPKPKVDSALIGLHFIGSSALQSRLAGVRPKDLRRVVTATFQQRRKTVRNSLRKLLQEVFHGNAEQVTALLNASPGPLPDAVRQAAIQGDAFAATQQLPDDWASKRPEELSPGQFVELTRLIFGSMPFQQVRANGMNDKGDNTSASGDDVLGKKVWRKLKHGTS
jgi:16S rRNA (adenine1518-N6/adenine1519-N6)-dimethyltransferase